MRPTLKEYTTPVVVTVVVLVLSFFLHLKWCGTSMTHSEEIWQEMLQYHLTTHPLSIRYFTSYPLLALHNLLLLPVRESFFVMQFLLAFILGPVFYHYLRKLRFSKSESNLGVFLMLSAYPVLCAFFEPVHTWDDFWAYLFATLALASVVRGKLGLGVFYFTLGCFAREQTLIFYPVLVLAAGWFSNDISSRKRVFWLVLPLIVYGVFYGLVWQEPQSMRFKLIYFNFEHSLRARDTIFSLFIAFGFLWLVSATALMRLIRVNRSAVERLLFWGTVIAAPATLILALFFSRTRETRILFPPFVVLVPLAITELASVWSYVTRKRELNHRLAQLVVFGILMGVGFYLGKLAFPYFEYRNCGRFAQQWAGIHIGLILNLLAFYVARRLFGQPSHHPLTVR